MSNMRKQFGLFFLFFVFCVNLLLAEDGNRSERKRTQPVKRGNDNGVVDWGGLESGKWYLLWLNANDVDPLDFKVPSAWVKSDGGDNWKVFNETARLDVFLRPEGKAVPPIAGKFYKPRFGGEFVVKGGPGNGGGGGEPPTWSLDGIYSVGDIVTEPGSVEVLFSASVSKDDIRKKIEQLFGDKTPSLDRDAIIAKLKAAFEQLKLEGKLPADFDIDKKAQEAYDKIKDSILAEIAAKIDDLNKAIDKAIDDAASKTKRELDECSPAILFSSEYTYLDGQRDPGEPGWGELKTLLRPDQKISLRGHAGYNLPLTIDGKPLGIGAGIQIEIGGTISISIDISFSEVGASGPSPKKRPKATVSAMPAVSFTLTGDFEAHAGIKVGVGATIPFTSTLPRVQGEIEAGKDKKAEKGK